MRRATEFVLKANLLVLTEQLAIKWFLTIDLLITWGEDRDRSFDTIGRDLNGPFEIVGWTGERYELTIC